MNAAHDALRWFAAAELGEWRGLPEGLSLADVGVVLPLEEGATGNGYLGEERRPARWISARSEVYRGGLRIWHVDGAVLVVEGRDPFDDAGTPLAAPDIGEPEAMLDTVLGRLTLAGGEHVHAALGLGLRVNPENGLLLGVVGFAPVPVDDYRARLRPELSPSRLLPRAVAEAKVR